MDNLDKYFVIIRFSSFVGGTDGPTLKYPLNQTLVAKSVKSEKFNGFKYSFYIH